MKQFLSIENKWILGGVVVIGVGVGVAYCIYKQRAHKSNFLAQSGSKIPAHARPKKSWHETFILCLLNSMPSYIDISKTRTRLRLRFGELPPALQENSHKQLEEDVKRVDTKVCEEKGWTLDEYYAELEKQKHRDPKVMELVKMFDEVKNCALAGLPLKVAFDLPSDLSGSNTLVLYEWISMCDFYLLRESGLNDSIEQSEEEQQASFDNRKMKGLNRGKALFEKLKIPLAAGEDYEILLRKAFYTHWTSDEKFKESFEKLEALENVLGSKLKDGTVVPELSQDPFAMTLDNFRVLYQALQNKYNVKDDEAEAKKTLNNADYADSTHMEGKGEES